MNLNFLRRAAISLGHVEPISIEPDGTIWLGIDPDRIYLTAAEQTTVFAKAEQIKADTAAARASVVAKLSDLGLTFDEIATLVGG